MTLSLYPEIYAVCRLDVGSAVPSWAFEGRFSSVSQTEDELSIVCETKHVPEAIKGDKDWRAFKLHGPFAFDEVGVVASLATPLAEQKIGIFVISTYDTDYLLVKEHQLEETLAVLKKEHEIKEINE